MSLIRPSTTFSALGGSNRSSEADCGEKGAIADLLTPVTRSDAVQVLLQIIGGPAMGRRFRLRQGQIATVGRTEWSDFSVPDDSEMADVHFQLHCEAYRCTLRRLATSQETQRNGEPVEETSVRSGDKICAGGTSFLVTLEGAPDFVPGDGASHGESANDDRPPAASIAEGLELSAGSQTLLVEGIKADAFLEALKTGGHHADAVTFLAAWLSPAKSVAWGCGCLKQMNDGRLNAAQVAGLEAAEKWSTEPTEENRRAAQAAAEKLQNKSPAAWIALAAFWSEGSIGPPDAPEIPAAKGMTARAVANVVTSVAAWGGPGVPASATLGKFIEEGRAMLK